MSNSIKQFTYTKLANLAWDKHEFGISWNSFTWHKAENGVIVAAHNGHRIFEVHSDDTQYLIYNDSSHSQGVTNRYSLFVKDTVFATSKVKRANGRKEVTVSFTQGHRASGSATGQRRFRIDDNNGRLSLTPLIETQVEYVKDVAKYRAFNKQLKALRTVLTGQAKMGVYTEDYMRRKHHYINADSLRESLQSVITKAFGIKKSYVSYADARAFLISNTLSWIETPDHTLLRPIVLCCLYNNSSDSVDATENTIRRINNGLAMVQKHYLRSYCVKITESNNALSDESDDQDSKLLPPSGFREVQVSSEAQVC